MKVLNKIGLLVMVLLLASGQVFGQLPSDGLIGLYKFDSNFEDATNINIPASPKNGANLCTDRFGNKNSALWLDGIDDYLIAFHKYFQSPQTLKTMSISCWFQLLGEKRNSQYYIFDAREVGNTNSNQIAYLTIDRDLIQSLGTYFSTNEVNGNYWYNIVVTFDKKHTKFYLDGNLISDTKPPVGNICINRLNIGANINNGEFFKGKIDDLAIYDRVLNNEEIKYIIGNDNSQFSNTVIEIEEEKMRKQKEVEDAKIFTGNYDGILYNYNYNNKLLEGGWYKGNLVKGKPTGYGKWTKFIYDINKYGGFHYTEHGVGYHLWYEYEGNWNDGLFDGKGIYSIIGVDKNLKIYQKGEWSNNKYLGDSEKEAKLKQLELIRKKGEEGLKNGAYKSVAYERCYNEYGLTWGNYERCDITFSDGTKSNGVLINVDGYYGFEGGSFGTQKILYDNYDYAIKQVYRLANGLAREDEGRYYPEETSNSSSSSSSSNIKCYEANSIEIEKECNCGSGSDIIFYQKKSVQCVKGFRETFYYIPKNNNSISCPNGGKGGYFSPNTFSSDYFLHESDLNLALQKLCNCK